MRNAYPKFTCCRHCEIGEETLLIQILSLFIYSLHYITSHISRTTNNPSQIAQPIHLHYHTIHHKQQSIHHHIIHHKQQSIHHHIIHHKQQPICHPLRGVLPPLRGRGVGCASVCGHTARLRRNATALAGAEQDDLEEQDGLSVWTYRFAWSFCCLLTFVFLCMLQKIEVAGISILTTYIHYIIFE